MQWMFFLAPLCVLAIVLVHTSAVRSLWYDEAATYDFARMSWLELWRAIHRSDAFYGLYYSFMHIWTGIFGTSPLAWRFPSMLGTLGSITLSYWFVKKLVGERIGLLTAMLMMTNSFFIHYGAEARAYSLFVFFTTAMSVVAYRLIEKNQITWWLTYAALSLVSIHIHLFAVFVMIAHLICFSLLGKKSQFYRSAVLCVALLILTLPVLWLAQNDVNSLDNWMSLTKIQHIATLFGAFASSPILWRINLLLALLGFVVGYRSTKRTEYLFIACWAIVPIALVLGLGHFRPLFTPKYLLEMFVPYVALCASGISALWRPWSSLVLAVVMSLQIHVLFHPKLDHEQDWQRASAILQGGLANSEIILYPQIGFAPLHYYAPNIIKDVIYPRHFNIAASGDMEPIEEIHPQAQDVWLVLNSLQDSPELEPGTAAVKKHLQSRYTEHDIIRLTGITMIHYIAVHE